MQNRRRIVRFVFQVTVCALLLGASSLLRADDLTWDAASQFSTTSNPNGVWDYGYTTSLGGAITPYTVQESCGGLQGWSATSSAPEIPWVLGNSTSSTQSCGTGQTPVGLLDMHPGANGEYSDVEFTAPEDGLYDISGFFEGIDPYPPSVDVDVLVGGVSVFAGEINSYLQPVSFSLSETLAAGTTIDFLVVADGRWTYDSTGFDATITDPPFDAPEPATLGLLSWGIGVLGFFQLRRKVKL